MKIGFDAPELEASAKREIRLRYMSRITAAALAIVEGGGEEDAHLRRHLGEEGVV